MNRFFYSFSHTQFLCGFTVNLCSGSVYIVYGMCICVLVLPCMIVFVYKLQILVLSQVTIGQVSIGHVINLASNDVQRFDLVNIICIQCVHTIYMIMYCCIMCAFTLVYQMHIYMRRNDHITFLCRDL